jgi:hypothetical protein
MTTWRGLIGVSMDVAYMLHTERSSGAILGTRQEASQDQGRPRPQSPVLFFMAMAQLASTTPSAAAASGPASKSPSETQALLAQFDAKINTMMDYPAKDTINALTMLAERKEFAPEIVSFLETKIHRVTTPYCRVEPPRPLYILLHTLWLMLSLHASSSLRKRTRVFRGLVRPRGSCSAV